MKDPALTIYEIEERVFGRPLKTISLGRCQEFLTKVVNSPEFKKKFPHRRLSKAVVHPSPPGFPDSCAGYGEMWLVSEHQAECVVLHELAHAINSKHRPPFHGKSFRDRFLFLVKTFMPKRFGTKLKREFSEIFGD